ncbi:hypothetical protein CB1_000978033 [Camelus ferus]|nr:hypothetical protein CB1_000978033 [Camelus ferus]
MRDTLKNSLVEYDPSQEDQGKGTSEVSSPGGTRMSSSPQGPLRPLPSKPPVAQSSECSLGEPCARCIGRFYYVPYGSVKFPFLDMFQVIVSHCPWPESDGVANKDYREVGKKEKQRTQTEIQPSPNT